MLNDEQLREIIGNTVAVLGPAAEHKDKWRNVLANLEKQARDAGDEDTAGFAAALARLLDADKDKIETITPDVPETYREVWGQLAALLSGEAIEITPEKAKELQRLADLLMEWMQVPDREDSRKFLKDHQAELLSDDAVLALQILIQGNPGVEALKDHLILLRACRELGVDEAFDRLAGEE